MIILLVVGAFFLGGITGLIGMAVFSYGPRTIFERERIVLMKRLSFLEHENGRKRFKMVKDPRHQVHQLQN